MTDDRDWSWLHHPQPAAPPVREERLWALVKGARRAEATVRLTPAWPELRISVDGELFWSRVYRGAGDDLVEAADAKRLEFVDLGWAAAGPRA
jgi:hypothetical protein